MTLRTRILRLLRADGGFFAPCELAAILGCGEWQAIWAVDRLRSHARIGVSPGGGVAYRRRHWELGGWV